MSSPGARELGLTSTVGILHDGDGQLRPLAADHLAIYQDSLEPDQKMFAFAQYDRFQRNIALGPAESLALPRRRPHPLYL
jgi:hypothetical protein